MSSIRVLMVTDHACSGGAAVAASRLQAGLQNVGHEVIRAAAHTETDEEAIRTPRRPSIAGALNRANPSWGRDLAQSHFRNLLDRVRPDVVNLHNLHGALPVGWSERIVEVCASRIPTVWTLHDMWSFTGGCAYSFGSELWKTGCDERCTCPDAYPKGPSGSIAPRWQERERLLREHPDLVAVTPSGWLRDRALQGLWRSHQVTAIANPLPLDIFTPDGRDEARRSLGLSAEHRVLLASAADLDDPRKGTRVLLEALDMIETSPITVLWLGRSRARHRVPGVSAIELGYVQDEEASARAYRAADLFVHPALEDNLPNVVGEALACGTPALAFRVGGLPEMITPGETGWLVDGVDARALAVAIDRALEDPGALARMRVAARRAAEATFDAVAQTSAYVGVFKDAIDAHRRLPAT